MKTYIIKTNENPPRYVQKFGHASISGRSDESWYHIVEGNEYQASRFYNEADAEYAKRKSYTQGVKLEIVEYY